MLKSGVDFPTISQWLGQASLDTTMRYSKADIEMKRQALTRRIDRCPRGIGQCGAAPSPDQVFDCYVAAVHAGDMETVRSLIATDVERSDFAGCSPAMDNASCLAHYLAVTVVEPKARLTLVRKIVEGDTLSVDVEVRSLLYTKVGVERIVGRDILQVREGLIRSFRFVPNFEDVPTAVFFGALGIGPRAASPAARP